MKQRFTDKNSWNSNNGQSLLEMYNVYLHKILLLLFTSATPVILVLTYFSTAYG